MTTEFEHFSLDSIKKHFWQNTKNQRKRRFILLEKAKVKNYCAILEKYTRVALSIELSVCPLKCSAYTQTLCMKP